MKKLILIIVLLLLMVGCDDSQNDEYTLIEGCIADVTYDFKEDASSRIITIEGQYPHLVYIFYGIQQPEVNNYIALFCKNPEVSLSRCVKTIEIPTHACE